MATLNVKIGANLRELERSMSRVQRTVQDTGKRISSFGKSMSKMVTGPLVAFGAGALAAADRTGRWADEILDLESTTGLATNTIQEFRAVARAAGTDQDALANSTQMLQRRMSRGEEGSADMRRAIEQLGISTQNADGSMRDMDELMPDIIRNLGEIESTTERARLGNQLFSSSWEQIAPIVAMGGDAIDEATQKARESGEVMSGEALRDANEFRQAIDELRNEFTVMGRNLMSDLMPVIQDTFLPAIRRVMDRVADAATWVGQLDAGTLKLTAAIGGLVAGIGPAIAIIGGLVTAIGALLSPIGLTIAALGALAAGVLYVVDNWDALIERFSDINWWRNAIIDMAKFLIENNPLSLIHEGFNAILRRFGREEIPNPFVGLSDELDDLRGKTNDYEHEFGSFSDAMVNGFNRAKDAITSFTGDFFELDEVTKQAKDNTRAYRDELSGLQTDLEHTTDQQRQLSGAIEGVGDPVAGMQERMEGALTGIHDHIAIAENMATNFVNSFGDGMANVVVQGEKLTEVLSNIGRLVASQGIQTAISLMLGGTGMVTGGGISGGLLGAFFNDAIISPDGNVTRFHPDDKMVMMRNVPENGGGSQNIHVTGEIKGRGRDIVLALDEARRTFE